MLGVFLFECHPGSACPHGLRSYSGRRAGAGVFISVWRKRRWCYTDCHGRHLLPAFLLSGFCSPSGSGAAQGGGCCFRQDFWWSPRHLLKGIGIEELRTQALLMVLFAWPGSGSRSCGPQGAGMNPKKRLRDGAQEFARSSATLAAGRDLRRDDHPVVDSVTGLNGRRNVATLVVDHDRSRASRELVEPHRLGTSGCRLSGTDGGHRSGARPWRAPRSWERTPRLSKEGAPRQSSSTASTRNWQRGQGTPRGSCSARTTSSSPGDLRRGPG